MITTTIIEHMKKLSFTLVSVIVLLSSTALTASAQGERSAWTINTRGWTTNYFTSIIWNAAEYLVKTFSTTGLSKEDRINVDRIIPESNWIFPIGLQKEGFTGDYDIYGAYKRAFGNPFTNPGDFGIGIDASYFPSFMGVYGGAYFKSQELIFSRDLTNLRAFYFQPRGGIIFGSLKHQVEVGVYYDKVVGSAGTCADTDLGRLEGGLGLDFALSRTLTTRNRKAQIQFSMPLHNFLNERYPGQEGMKRRVAYIMSTYRIYF